MEPVSYVTISISLLWLLIGTPLLVVGVVALYALRRLVNEMASREEESRAAIDRLSNIFAARDQAGFWTPDWQAGEREAEEDLAAGRGVLFHSEAEMDAYLDEVPLPMAHRP